MREVTFQNKDIVYPVVLRVPDDKKPLTGKDFVQFLRQYARQAVMASARKNGIDLAVLEKDATGAPLPVNGFHWSLSHKPEYVAGVVAAAQTGIDIEPVKPVQPSLFDRVIDDNERQLADAKSDELFFRYWTAKEAVLKAAGAGFTELFQCKIIRVADRNALAVSFRQKRWMVEQTYYDNHVISVVANHGTDIQWILPDHAG